MKAIVRFALKHPRAVLAIVVAMACVVSIVGLFVVGRGGAISDDNHQKAIRELVSIYSPLTALLFAFYFGDKQNRPKTDSTARFVVALIGLAAWSFAPIVLFAMTQVVEKVISYLDTLRGWGETIALAVLGFYFRSDKTP